MELDELKTIWKQQKIEEEDYLSKDQLLMMLNNKMISFDENIKKRDWREIGIAILMSLIFGVLFFVLDSFWSKLGCVTIILACGFISYKLVAARGEVAGENKNPAVSFKEHLTAELKKVETQKKLLKNVLWWYLTPLFIGILFFFIGLYTGIILILHIIFMIVVCGIVWGLNHYAVSKYIDPIITDIKDAIKFIENPENESQSE